MAPDWPEPDTAFQWRLRLSRSGSISESRFVFRYVPVRFRIERQRENSLLRREHEQAVRVPARDDQLLDGFDWPVAGGHSPPRSSGIGAGEYRVVGRCE